MKKNVLLLISVVLILTGCADVESINECVNAEPYGFLSGLWHGIIMPFSFIGSLFSDDIAMYAVNNSGGWYDFGYCIGVGLLTGSSKLKVK